MSYEYVFHLNNFSVSCFEHGWHDSAIASLTAAGNKLLLLDKFASPATNSRNDSTLLLTNAQPKHASFCTISMDWVKLFEPDVVRTVLDNLKGPEMYNYALVLSIPNRKNQISKQLVRATLEYNLAIIHHWRAMNHGASTEWSAALYHYELAWNSISSLRHGAEQLALAVMNNMGHIHHHLTQFSQARRCFSVLRWVVATRVGSISLLEEMEDYEIFVMSAMLPTPDWPLAPAA